MRKTLLNSPKRRNKKLDALSGFLTRNLSDEDTSSPYNVITGPKHTSTKNGIKLIDHD